MTLGALSANLNRYLPVSRVGICLTGVGSRQQGRKAGTRRPAVPDRRGDVVSGMGAADSGGTDVPESLLRLVADSVPALIAYYDKATLHCRFANRRYAEYNGWTTQSILGKPLREVIGPAADDLIRPHVDAVRRGEAVHYRREQVLPDGGSRMIEVNLIPHFEDGGEQIGAFVLINDITDQWRAEQMMRESETRMRKFAEASEEGIVFIKDGIITDANPALARMVGYSVDELIGRRNLDFVPELWKQTVLDNIRHQHEQPYEAGLLHRDGHVIPVEFVGKSMPYEGEIHRLTVVRDITWRKQAQERIEFLALHDVLTQLPNRHYLNEYLPRTLALARRQGQAVAVLFIDLDGFKKINDTLGHESGDAALCEVARRLQAAVRSSDLVARLGGDEFLAVLPGVDAPADAVRVADNLLRVLQEPVDIYGHRAVVLPSIGISLFPQQGETMDALISRADAAMYRAKNAGGNRYDLSASPA